MAKKYRRINSFEGHSEEEGISRYLDYLEEQDELVRNYSSQNSCEDDMMSSEEWIERLYMD